VTRKLSVSLCVFRAPLSQGELVRNILLIIATTIIAGF
jgi:hypothetical protein